MHKVESQPHVFQNLPENSKTLLSNARTVAIDLRSQSVQIEHLVIAAAQSHDPELDQVLGLTDEERDTCVKTFTQIVKEKDRSPQSALGLGRHRLNNVLQPPPFPTHPDGPRFHSEVLFKVTDTATKAQFKGNNATPATIIKSLLQG